MQQSKKLMKIEKAVFAIHDPPYNLIAFDEYENDDFVEWCRKWI